MKSLPVKNSGSPALRGFLLFVRRKTICSYSDGIFQLQFR